jgi:hypothetical protein
MSRASRVLREAPMSRRSAPSTKTLSALFEWQKELLLHGSLGYDTY